MSSSAMIAYLRFCLRLQFSVVAVHLQRERERELIKTLTGEGAKGERGGEGTGEGENEGESVYESESAAEDEGGKDGRCMRRQNEGGRKTRM